MYIRLCHVVLKISKAIMCVLGQFAMQNRKLKKAAVFLHHLYIIGLKIVPRVFGVLGRMWNSLLSVPDHCIYFLSI